jgi:4-hydroxyacetophenone monooxygenase
MSVHLQPAEKPITEDDATIARMLEHASVPTLMMSIVHVTGDTSLLARRDPPKKPMINEYHGGLTAEENAAVRAAHSSASRPIAIAAARCPHPVAGHRARDDELHRRRARADDYVPIMLEDSRSMASIRASRAGASPCPKPCANGFMCS